LRWCFRNFFAWTGLKTGSSILLISTSQVARITGRSYWSSANTGLLTCSFTAIWQQWKKLQEICIIFDLAPFRLASMLKHVVIIHNVPCNQIVSVSVSSTYEIIQNLHFPTHVTTRIAVKNMPLLPNNIYNLVY
jgi:hypothetical protein